VGATLAKKKAASRTQLKKANKKSRIKDAAKKVLEVFPVDPAYVYEC
jgi:hypothetical protein